MAARKAFSRELPSFGWRSEEWPLFISVFERSTPACAFTQDENLLRLQKCLKGDALEALRNRLLVPSMVPNVIETMKMMFGKPETIIYKLIDDIRKQPSPRIEKIETIINFSNVVQNLSATMEASGLTAHLCNPTLLLELSERLPSMMKYDWAKYRATTNNANLITFSNWLEQM